MTWETAPRTSGVVQGDVWHCEWSRRARHPPVTRRADERPFPTGPTALPGRGLVGWAVSTAVWVALVVGLLVAFAIVAAVAGQPVLGLLYLAYGLLYWISRGPPARRRKLRRAEAALAANA